MSGRKGLETSSSRSPRCKQLSLAPLLTIAVLIALQGSANSGCPMDKGEDPSLGEMVYYSDVVLLGTVLRRVGDPLMPESHVAEMEVHCIYKGTPLPAKVNISQADSTVDGCQTNYTVGASVIAYLQRTDKGVYRSKYRENPEQYADEILILCNISAMLPLGADPDDEMNGECQSYEQEGCLPVQPTTKSPLIVPTGKTPAPIDINPEPEDEDNDSDEDQLDGVPYDRQPGVEAVEEEDEEDYEDNGSVVVRMPGLPLVISFMTGIILLS